MNSKKNTFIEKEISLIDLFYRSINILFSLRKTILALLEVSERAVEAPETTDQLFFKTTTSPD